MIISKKLAVLMLRLFYKLAFTVKAQEVMETGGAKPMPAQWVDNETGHKVVRWSIVKMTMAVFISTIRPLFLN
jgi:oligogalacturonide lyase